MYGIYLDGAGWKGKWKKFTVPPPQSMDARTAIPGLDEFEMVLRGPCFESGRRAGVRVLESPRLYFTKESII